MRVFEAILLCMLYLLSGGLYAAKVEGDCSVLFFTRQHQKAIGTCEWQIKNNSDFQVSGYLLGEIYAKGLSVEVDDNLALV
ncbi:MAG: hypothetical protein JMN26_18445 [gamma proteobacterium endosymbiont of Lamellibrachia anaximandri]|nr:hypothetical protein [gamma proteobacterium endosymbiont of Lamellibrachia anaximandri]